MFLTLDQQQITFAAPQAGARERLAAATASFAQMVGGFPGFTGFSAVVDDESEPPGRGVACAFYSYAQDLRGIPEWQGVATNARSVGQLCVDTDAPPGTGFLVIAELNMAWGSAFGAMPARADGEAARRTIETLRIE